MVWKCAQCGEILIREELEDPEFLAKGRSEFGGPVCFECFEGRVLETTPEAEILEKILGGRKRK